MADTRPRHLRTAHLEETSTYWWSWCAISGLRGRPPLPGPGHCRGRLPLNCRCVLVASGDMSHKLKEDGLHGFALKPTRSSTASRPSFCPWEFGRPAGSDAALSRWCRRSAGCAPSRSWPAPWRRPASLSLPVFRHEALRRSYARRLEIENAPSTEEEAHPRSSGKRIARSTAPAVGLPGRRIRRRPDRGSRLGERGIHRRAGRRSSPAGRRASKSSLGRRAGAFVSLHEHGQLAWAASAPSRRCAKASPRGGHRNEGGGHRAPALRPRAPRESLPSSTISGGRARRAGVPVSKQSGRASILRATGSS